MRADRLLSMLLLLQARGRITARALANELEVSVRTIYRDLDALSSAGIPVVAEAGHGGGCQLLPGFRSPLAGLTPQEAGALLVLGIPQPLRDLGLGGSWQAAQRKLATAAADSRSAPGPDIHLDVQAWFPSPDKIDCLPAIALAIRERRKLAMVHRRLHAPPTRSEIEPLGLVNKAGIWYLLTQDPTGHVVVYRVGRIESVEVLDSLFTRPPGFDLARAWSVWSTEFVTSRPRLDVTLRVSGEVFRILPEVFGDQVAPDLAAAGDPDARGWRTLVLRFEHAEAACHRLLGFGAEVEVLDPEAVRILMQRTAAAALTMYST